MKNKLLKILTFVFFTTVLNAENLDISAKNITVDKESEITVFNGDVVIKDVNGTTINSEYASYNKKLNFFNLKKSVVVTDSSGNQFKSPEATYDANLKYFNSIGETIITTSQGYRVETEDIFFNKTKNIILSKKKTKIIDVQKNIINLENFEYHRNKNIFKSIGNIKILDKMKNSYEFSQIYIDEKKREIIGTDSKAYLNNQNLKLEERNKPRIFSNAISIKDNQSKFIKSKFTMCDYRSDNKCPPWELSASTMTHNKKNKTIYYENALIKVYDVPIFYLPRLSHPDPTVDRRSGFLTPSFSDTKNLGSSINVPYFWAINKDKDLTINNRLFATENPLFLGEYRQDFKNSDLIFDFGYTEGYKDNTKTKKAGNRSHFFSKFIKSFESENEEIQNNLEVNIQHVSNKKYLKLYRIDSNLVNYETGTLENYLDYSHFNDNQNLYASVKTSAFKTLADTFNDQYEYILPEVNLSKNLFSEKLGYGDLSSNLKVYNYDTNKYKKFLINNFEWTQNKSFLSSIYDGKILTNLKNVNYKNENVEKFKDDTTNELFGSIGYLASIDLYKKDKSNEAELLKPKMLLRYSPNHMRNEDTDFNLHNSDIFSLNRLSNNENYESGTNLTLGLDYEKNTNNNEINFSIGQIINEKRFSDIIGNFNVKNENLKVDYNYSLDQNYKEMNYNEITTDYKLDNITLNFNYLEENKMIDEKEYLKTKIGIKKGNNGEFSFSNKRNLITNSSEYYNLSYEYINDCLRAGIIYRREFYNDSELESENSLMFQITLNTFGSLTSPGLAQ